jgi:hypothetical protein
MESIVGRSANFSSGRRANFVSRRSKEEGWLYIKMRMGRKDWGCRICQSESRLLDDGIMAL